MSWLDQVAEALNLQRTPDGHVGLCPLHGGEQVPLVATQAGSKVLLRCAGGCLPNEIVNAVDGVEMEWIAADRRATKSKRGAKAGGQEDGRKEPSTADKIVALALDLYEFIRSPEGDAYAIRKDGPRIAVPLSAGSRGLKADLSRAYRRLHERTPNGTALSDALTSLEGEAREGAVQDIHLRIASAEGAVVIDLGRPDGLSVVVEPSGWRLDPSRVLFRRTELTGEQVLPEPGGTLALLGELVNVAARDLDLLVAYLVAALVPWVEPPILLLGGEQDTGKTTAATLLAALIDPSPAPVQAPPRTQEAWVVRASGSHLLVVDNVSGIPGWFSDLLCRTVTGEGQVVRRLYTDSDRCVFRFRRPVVLTSIDAGALRGDLASRLVVIDLERIDPASRRAKSELASSLERHQAKLLGAMLDLLARVLEALPGLELQPTTRMADFERVLAAVDHVRGTSCLERFQQQEERIAEDVVEGDPVAGAVLALMDQRDSWEGTSTALLQALRGCLDPTEKQPEGFPKHPRGLSGQLKRLAPALRKLGVELTPSSEKNRSQDRRRERIWRISKVSSQDDAPASVQTVQPSAGPVLPSLDGAEQRTIPWTVELPTASHRPADRPSPNGADGSQEGKLDDADGADGRAQDSVAPAPSDQEVFEERAAIREYDGVPWAAAERLAAEDVIAQAHEEDQDA